MSGKPKTFDITSAGSGKVIHIHFCDTCGTKLFMSFERYDDIYGVFTGTFDDPNWYPRPADTTRYFYVQSMADGVAIPPGHPVFHGHSLKLDGSANTPQIFGKPTVVNEKVRQAAFEFAQAYGEA